MGSGTRQWMLEPKAAATVTPRGDDGKGMHMLHDRQPLPEFGGRIAIDRESGHIFSTGPVLTLRGPVVVVRHGETDANNRKALQGVSDSSENQLNARGTRQAGEAARDLYTQLIERYGVAKLHHLVRAGHAMVLTSPLGRAKATMRAFVEYVFGRTGCRLQPREWRRLTEMSFGTADGLSVEEMRGERLHHLADITRTYRTQHAAVSFDGGESFLDVLKRGTSVLKHINTTFDKGRAALCVVFAHGLMISALRAAVGDPGILNANGRIDFRARRLEHAVPCWLPSSDMPSGA